nr:HD domain-containing protein [uncultured Blautia sp.]
MGCFYHIRAVADNAAKLAKQFGADEEVVIIAAWLHDVASITDYNLYEEHHIHGAKMAKEILEKFDYDKEKTAQVQSCVLNHRGSISGERLSLEELCVADADAISHFDNVPSLLYLAYVKRNLDIDEGKEFVKAKLMRSYEKLSEESKIFYRDKFEQVMSILN